MFCAQRHNLRAGTAPAANPSSGAPGAACAKRKQPCQQAAAASRAGSVRRPGRRRLAAAALTATGCWWAASGPAAWSPRSLCAPRCRARGLGPRRRVLAGGRGLGSAPSACCPSARRGRGRQRVQGHGLRLQQACQAAGGVVAAQGGAPARDTTAGAALRAAEMLAMTCGCSRDGLRPQGRALRRQRGWGRGWKCRAALLCRSAVMLWPWHRLPALSGRPAPAMRRPAARRHSSLRP